MSHGPWVDIPDLVTMSEPDPIILSGRPRVITTRLHGDAYPPLNPTPCPEGWADLTIRVRPGHDWQYAWMWCQIWGYPADTIAVERDVYPTRAQVEELAVCSGDFCTMAYDGRLGGLATHLGFVRVSEAAMRRAPEMALRALWRGHGHHQVVTYLAVAERIHSHMERLGCPVHVHRGRVRHR